MKSNPLASLLATLVLIGALIIAWMSLRYYFSVRELQKLQAQTLAINTTRTAVQALANEAIEYSRRNPAMDPLLEKFQIKVRATNAPSPLLPTLP